MYYGGESNVPGAPGNLFAGGPSFDIPRGPGALGGRSEEQIRRLQQNMPENRQLLDEMKRRGITPGGGPQLPLAGIPGSSNLPGAVGNMAGIANSTFFEGPQFAQPGSAQELGAEAGRALGSPAVRFNPNELAVPPGQGVMQSPGYTPFRLEQGRDRFILHDPRSGVAGVGAPPAGFQGKYVS
jgi:hypothetical protein